MYYKWILVILVYMPHGRRSDNVHVHSGVREKPAAAHAMKQMKLGASIAPRWCWRSVGFLETSGT